MELNKVEYQNLLAVLHRVELRGLNEAREITTIAAKIEHTIATWPAPAQSANQLELFTEEKEKANG